MRVIATACATLLVAFSAMPAYADAYDDCQRIAIGANEKQLQKDVCTRAIQATRGNSSKQAHSYNARGLAYLNGSEWDQALADFNAAIRLDPRHYGAHDNRGDALRGKGLYEDALRSYAEALRLNPQFISAHLNRAITYEKMGNIQFARQEYERVLVMPSTGRDDPLERWARGVAAAQLKRLNSQ